MVWDQEGLKVAVWSSPSLQLPQETRKRKSSQCSASVTSERLCKTPLQDNVLPDNQNMRVDEKDNNGTPYQTG